MARPELWQAPPRGSRLGAAALGLFLLSIVAARFLIADHVGLAVLALPFLLLALALAVGILPGLILLALFVVATLSLRLYFLYVHPGWPVLLLGPVVALALLIAFRVVRKMRRPSGGGGAAPKE